MSTAVRSRKTKAATAGATAARAIVQMLAVTGKRFTLEELRERLREFYREEPGEAVRAAAALSAMDLLSALLDLNTALAGAGLQVRVVNGLVSLGTTRPESERLREYLERETPEGAEELTPALMEVLSLIAFRQPVSQGEIDGIFGGTGRRAMVARLREMGLVEEVSGEGGRILFGTTQGFLKRFSLQSLHDLKAENDS